MTLFFAALSFAGTDVGIFQQPDCRVLTPVSGKTFCFDQTANALKAWNGSAWVNIVFASNGVVSVSDYGATGDGTTDDTVAVQATATAATGKIMLFPSGATYLVSSIVIPAGTTVVMDGAIVKQRILNSRDGSPIFDVRGPAVTFRGGTLDGQRENQPKDGFSDSYDTGGNRTGRAYRAGIKADAAANGYITNLAVEGVKFQNLYGACVATLDVPVVTIRGSKAANTNFELGFLYHRAATLTDAILTGNEVQNIGSHHAATNANAFVVSNYQRVDVSHNLANRIERALVKIEGGQNILVSSNILDTNTVDDYPGIQIDGLNTVSRVTIADNTLYNTGKGIYLAKGNVVNTNITGNTIHTTTGTTAGDGIVIDSAIANLLIGQNTLVNIKRNGIFLSSNLATAIIQGNILLGQRNATNHAIRVGAYAGSVARLSIVNNTCADWAASAVGDGVVLVEGSGGHTFASVLITGNHISAGGPANRGLRSEPANVLITGMVANNYIDGKMEMRSSGIAYRDNLVTGTVTLPPDIANLSNVGKTQATVGPAGTASSLPANPSGYYEIKKNGTSYVVPYYLKSK
jgi:hypothetical protein